MPNNIISLDKTYRSEKFEGDQGLKFDPNHKKRPSWVKVKLDKKIIFIKILFNGEAFWYRRYFQDYFFIFEPTSEDYKNYYNEIAENYESYVPQNKILGDVVNNFLNEFKVQKDAKILDLGGGTGIVTEEIAKAGYNNLTLLDISNKELELAKNKEFLKNAHYQNIDLTKEDIKGKFDVIFETMSLDYFKGDKMGLVLKKIKNSLVEGGKFIIIDRHIYPEFNNYFKEIKKGKKEIETPEGMFDYYYFIGEN